MTRHAATDPGDTAFAREFDRGLCRARDNEMAHAIVAVDKRRCWRCALHRDVWARICRLEAQPLNILREAKDAVRVGTDQIGLQHELSDLAGVILGHTGFAHCIDDQTGNDSRWNSHRFGGLDVHDFPDSRASAREPRIVALSASEIFNDCTCFTQSNMPMS